MTELKVVLAVVTFFVSWKQGAMGEEKEFYFLGI